MTTRVRVVLLVLWVSSLVGVGVLVSAAKQRAGTPPVVISGDDVGFRVESQRGDIRIGTLVVRINGEWVPVQFSTSLRPATE
jgi:hypothetical protein